MSTVSREKWCFGLSPREEIIFICQVTTALIVIICGLLNISLTETNTSLWATLVSGAVGYLLPNPRLNSRAVAVKKDVSFLHDLAVELIDGRPSGEHSGPIHDGNSPAGGTDG